MVLYGTSPRIVAVVVAALAAPWQIANGAPAANRITSLPGLFPLPSYPMYSGYVNVDAAADRNLFYWLVTAVSDSPTTPLVLWLTGGPGCSSLFALTSEHGFAFPSVADPTQLELNPYSWNQAANMIYLEAPAGVGFSYAGNGNYTTGDNATALDNYNFLAGFIKQYPEYAQRPFYVSGESYGGHYVPQLSALLAAKPIPGINLKGFFVGNPSFDGFYDSNNYWTFMSYHGLISSAQYQLAYTTCNGTFAGTLSPACSNMLQTFWPLFVDVDPYNIYAPCNGPSTLNGGCLTTSILGEAAFAASLGHEFDPVNLAQTVVPCTNVSGPVVYFTQQSVREALHVSPQAYAWDVCSVYFNYTQYAYSVRNIYLELKDQLDIVREVKLRRNHRMQPQSISVQMVFSGDVDSCVPYLGTEAAMDSLGLPVQIPYAKWYVNDTNNVPQIAGYYREYQTGNTLRYATVKDAITEISISPKKLSVFQQLIDLALEQHEDTLLMRLFETKAPDFISESVVRRFSSRAQVYMSQAVQLNEHAITILLNNVKAVVISSAKRCLHDRFSKISEELSSAEEIAAKLPLASILHFSAPDTFSMLYNRLSDLEVRGLVRETVLYSFDACKEMPGVAFIERQEAAISPTRRASSSPPSHQHSDAAGLIDEVVQAITVHVERLVWEMQCRKNALESSVLARQLSVQRAVVAAADKAASSHAEHTSIQAAESIALKNSRMAIIHQAAPISRAIAEMRVEQVNLRAAVCDLTARVGETMHLAVQEVSSALSHLQLPDNIFLKRVIQASHSILETADEDRPSPGKLQSQLVESAHKLHSLQSDLVGSKKECEHLRASLRSKEADIDILRAELLALCSTVQQHEAISSGAPSYHGIGS